MDPSGMTLKEWADALKAEADARTTPQLYFMTARAYHASARSLMKNPIPRLAHRDAPIRALLHHAAELYLKALLLLCLPQTISGNNNDEVRRGSAEQRAGRAVGLADILRGCCPGGLLRF